LKITSHCSSISHRAIIAGGIVFMIVGTALHGSSWTHTQSLNSPSEPIPQKDYKSWSLFLISSPEWLLSQSKEQLKALHDKFQVFGNAIGPENVAVWFWSEAIRWDSNEITVDVPRSVKICKSLKLKPSDGPYVVVMTKYPGQCVLSKPDSFPENTTPPLVIKLNGNGAGSTTHLLGDLADKLLTENLSQLQSKPDDYWNGWRNVFTKLSTFAVGLSSKVTVDLNTGPMKTEIKLAP
jgi:hypothetical protein